MTDEIETALEKIFGANSTLYLDRGFQRRIGWGRKPALLVIDMANAWTRPDHAFSCSDMETIIPAHEALLQAANFIETIEQRQGLKIACVEEIAYSMEYIDAEQLQNLAQPISDSAYGRYLLDLLEEDRR